MTAMQAESTRLEEFLGRCRKRIFFMNWLKLEMGFLIILLFILNFLEFLMAFLKTDGLRIYSGLLLPSLSLIVSLLVTAWKCPPTSMVAQIIDRIYQLKQRLETAWEVRNKKGEMVQFLLKDIFLRLDKNPPSHYFPFVWHKSWLSVPPLLFLYFLFIFYSPFLPIYQPSREFTGLPSELLQERARWQKLMAKNLDQGLRSENKDFDNLITLMQSLNKKLLANTISQKEIFQELNHMQDLIRRMRHEMANMDRVKEEKRGEPLWKIDHDLQEMSQEIEKSRLRFASLFYVHKDFLKAENPSPLAKLKDLSTFESQKIGSSFSKKGAGSEAGSSMGMEGKAFDGHLKKKVDEDPSNRMEREEELSNSWQLGGIPDISTGQGISKEDVTGNTKGMEHEHSSREISTQEIGERKIGTASEMEEFTSIEARRVLEDVLPQSQIPFHLRRYIRNYFLTLAGIKIE